MPKTKKFSRTARTISIQLVKNAFLTRVKTLSRKLEEILLVYISENNRIVSKERMLEAYFNIIEWGPNLYVIGEASRFYFQKSPSKSTFNECLFLARIIPSPQKIMYQFNNQEKRRDFEAKQESFLTNIMIKRGLLTAYDTIYKSQPLLISGAEKSYLRIKVQDSIPVDSLSTIKEFEF